MNVRSSISELASRVFRSHPSRTNNAAVDTGADLGNPELDDMSRSLRVSAALVAPIAVVMIADLIPGQPLMHALGHRTVAWAQLILALRTVSCMRSRPPSTPVMQRCKNTSATDSAMWERSRCRSGEAHSELWCR